MINPVSNSQIPMPAPKINPAPKVEQSLQTSSPVKKQYENILNLLAKTLDIKA